MVLKRSVFKIQKQNIQNINDPSYGYRAIHENFSKIAQNGKILEHFHELLHNHTRIIKIFDTLFLYFKYKYQDLFLITVQPTQTHIDAYFL